MLLLNTNFLADAILAPAVTWSAGLMVAAFIAFLSASAASQWVQEQ